MDFECMKKVVEDRHSVRVFTKQDIPEDILGEIMGYSLVTISLCTLFVEMSHFYEHAAFQDGSHTR